MCLKPSVLRVPLVHHLSNFHFDRFVNELKCKSLTLLAVLTAAAQPCRSKKREPDPFVIAMAAAVLLKQRNKDLCMVQPSLAVYCTLDMLLRGYVYKGC